MKYKHPKSYDGIPNTIYHQTRIKYRVENYCLKCSNFLGAEHDFEECKTKGKFTQWPKNSICVVPVEVGRCD
jgi:hypothetical protein